MNTNNDPFAYQKLMKELNDKIKLIQSSNPKRNSQDAINLIKLKMMKKNAETKYKQSIGGDLKSLFAR
jgi:hypothetical protein